MKRNVAASKLKVDGVGTGVPGVTRKMILRYVLVAASYVIRSRISTGTEGGASVNCGGGGLTSTLFAITSMRIRSAPAMSGPVYPAVRVRATRSAALLPGGIAI